MHIPRILLAAGSSGSGKTLITCGLLEALRMRNRKAASFKCGPDYIDPMFHSRVIGAKSRNLDTFFTSREITRYLLGVHASGHDIAVLEGVMGYYDGVAGTTTRASSYDLAVQTDTPVILIVNSRGMSTSLAAYVKGFLTYRKNSQIKGLIFNQMSPMLYPRTKKLLEEETDIRVFGYVPKLKDCVIDNRHLGLVLPHEVPELQEKLAKLAKVLEETLDLEGILKLASEAPELRFSEKLDGVDPAFSYHTSRPVRIGVAEDEAFCFFYEDNFSLLRHMGAELIPFSPIHDAHLPPGLDGLLLYGGYPELYGKELEENLSMKEDIRHAIRKGMPLMAECGGFMYLHKEMEDMEGISRKMLGILPGKVFRTKELTRFGYLTLTQNEDGPFGEIPAHEFHYFDSTCRGNAFHAVKPHSTREWDCMQFHDHMLAGFPHLYYYGNPKVPAAFLESCVNKDRRGLLI